MLAALDRDIYASDWADLLVKKEVRARLPEVFDSAAAGIKGALDFLEGLGVTSDRLLPYGLQLLLLGEFFRQRPQPNREQTALLTRWFWVTSFTGWSGGVNTAQVRRALGEIRSLARGTGAGFSVVDLDAPAQPFPKRFDGRSARVRAFLLYLASLRPRSLESGEELDPGPLLAARGTRAVGYVCSNLQSLGELSSSPANRMFLDAERTRQGFDLLAALPDEALMERLPGHGFPPDSSILRLREGDRERLVRERLETLIDGEREFMEARNVRLPGQRTGASIADSEASDEATDG